MRKIAVLKNWDFPNLIKQTPFSNGIWGDFEFILDPFNERITDCEYIIILNKPKQNYIVHCDPKHVWAILQEPPNEYFEVLQRAEKFYYRTYTTNYLLKGKKYIHSHPALPWHINRTYNQLIKISAPKKEKNLSWITSNKSKYKGHQERLEFLNRLSRSVKFDLWGRGYNSIADKWDGLAPYKYSIIFENYSNPLYWSEKLADAFLCWTYPIYYGCTEIEKFFPHESLFRFDISNPQAIEEIIEIVNGDLWAKNIDAIDYSRQLILNKYQFFPFITNEIINFESNIDSKEKIKKIQLYNQYSYIRKKNKWIRKKMDKVKKILRNGNDSEKLIL